MKKLTILALAGGFSLIAAAAQAEPTGAWKYTVGSNADCSLTINADQTASTTGTCPSGSYAVAHWTTSGPNLQLLTASDELVVIVKPKGDGYEGKRVADSRKVTLSH